MTHVGTPQVSAASIGHSAPHPPRHSSRPALRRLWYAALSRPALGLNSWGNLCRDVAHVDSTARACQMGACIAQRPKRVIVGIGGAPQSGAILHCLRRAKPEVGKREGSPCRSKLLVVRPMPESAGPPVLNGRLETPPGACNTWATLGRRRGPIDRSD